MKNQLTATIEAITPEEYALAGKGWTMEYGFADTPFGMCFIASTPRGIYSFQFVDDDAEAILTAHKQEWHQADHRQNDSMATAIIWDIFSNTLSKRGEPLKLHVKGTPFQLEVWEALLSIPLGEVVTYGELSQQMRRDKAVRAVASAIARNPVGLIIPCHRVIRSGGAVGQYHWGSKRKANMIAWEKQFPMNANNVREIY